MAKNKTTVRLEKVSVAILKTVKRRVPWPISLAALTNLIIQAHGPSFDPRKVDIDLVQS